MFNNVNKNVTIKHVKDLIENRFPNMDSYKSKFITLGYKGKKLENNKQLNNVITEIDKTDNLPSTIELKFATSPRLKSGEYLVDMPRVKSSRSTSKSRSIFNDLATLQQDIAKRGIDSLIGLEKKIFDSSSNKLAKLTKSSSRSRTRKSSKTRKGRKGRSLSRHKKRRKRSRSTKRRRNTI
tara:strand:- start:1092 stop:1634 length:543 start_codon:yes stop_codon:yes gene_type:complete